MITMPDFFLLDNTLKSARCRKCTVFRTSFFFTDLESRLNNELKNVDGFTRTIAGYLSEVKHESFDEDEDSDTSTTEKIEVIACCLFLSRFVIILKFSDFVIHLGITSKFPFPIQQHSLFLDCAG